MARFNEILVGRYNRFMQKLLSMKGDASLFQFSTEMGGYIPFFSGVENRYLEAWDRFAAWFNISAGAAIFANAELRNPTSSNVIAVIEKITCSAGGAGADAPIVRLGPATTDQAQAPGVVTVIDSRSQRSNSSLITSQSNAANQTVAGGQIWQGNFTLPNQAEVIWFEDHELTVNPGRALTLSSNIANQAIIFSVWWRERLLEESERT
jgi:hypothetical protein